jgi:hypothetical protein
MPRIYNVIQEKEFMALQYGKFSALNFQQQSLSTANEHSKVRTWGKQDMKQNAFVLYVSLVTLV